MKHYAITAGIAAVVVLAYHKGYLDFIMGAGSVGADKQRTVAAAKA